MYKNKDISTLSAIQWDLKHEATALSAYLIWIWFLLL
jgi:hypothetical protein